MRKFSSIYRSDVENVFYPFRLCCQFYNSIYFSICSSWQFFFCIWKKKKKWNENYMKRHLPVTGSQWHRCQSFVKSSVRTRNLYFTGRWVMMMTYRQVVVMTDWSDFFWLISSRTTPAVSWSVSQGHLCFHCSVIKKIYVQLDDLKKSWLTF